MDIELVSLPRSFFDRDPAEVAPDLLGKVLVRVMGDKLIIGKIVETEAYLSTQDTAAHGFKGMSARNKSLYKKAGHAYVHAMRQYFLLDVVTEGEGTPSSVLIRAVEPIQNVAAPTNGPGKVGKLFGITRALDGVDMVTQKGGLFIAGIKGAQRPAIQISSRIGISNAKDLLLRFYMVGNPHVSKARA